ncbi:MAG TPA: YdcF family protein [Gemmatimonadaceae bacterium]|nr:YdcF family protein [Gemmatimonadaceae bacterium]
MLTARKSSDLARDALTGAILGTLCAVGMYLLGVQQLLRRPELSLFLALTIVGALLGMTRLRPLLWVAGGILAVLCLGVAYTPLAANAAAPFIRRDSIPARVDAIAVLSMGGTPDGLMRSETLDRVLTGIGLTRRGLSDNMMISRETRSFGGNYVSDSADLASITRMAAPQASISFVDSIRTTRTEALRMLKIARPRGWSTLAVVTSPLHTRRACATFEAVGFKVVCVPAVVRGSGLVPNSNAEDRFRAFRLWLYETFATDTYRRRGWIK